MPNRKKFTPEILDRIIELLDGGNTITATCKAIGVSRMGEFKERMRNKEYRERVDEALKLRTEIVEDALFVTAVGGNVQAQRFFLINRGKERWKSEFGQALDGGGVPVIGIPIKEIVMRRKTKKSK